MKHAISQPTIFGGICKMLDRQGVKHFTARQANAIIEAANVIVDAMAKDDVPATPGMGLGAWLECDDVGASSLFLAAVLAWPTTRIDAEYSHPHDADDFERCLKLLAACPEMKVYLGRLINHPPHWSAIYAKWDRLEQWMAEGKHDQVTDFLERLK